MDNFKVLDAIQEIIYISDPDSYEVVYVNKVGREQIGLSLEEIKKHKCYEVFQNNNCRCEFCNNDRLKKEESCTWIRKNERFQTTNMLHDSLIEMDGKKYRMELAVDISNMEEDAIRVRDSLSIEKQLSECIKRLVVTNNFEESVDSVMDTILRHYNGDRAYIFEFDWDEHITSNTFESCAEGVEPEIDTLQNLDIDVLDVWIKLFDKGGIVNIPDLEKIKENPNRMDEYETLSRQNIRSLIAVPFWNNNVLEGFLGVDNPKNNVADIEFLEHLSFFISNEIQKNALTLNLKKLSYRDILTNCLNRNAYNEKLEELINWKEQYDAIGVLFIDMNGLKYLNDTFGHTYGDSMILKLSQILFRYFGDEQVYRISGDEFVIIDLNSEYHDFIAKAGKLRNILTIVEKNFASVGYVWENSDTDISILVQQAELQMYTQKKAFYMQNKSSVDRKRRPIYMDTMLEEMELDEFMVYLQPKCKTDTEEVVAAEALVRRRDKDGRIITPFEFIHALEKENMIAVIDFFVFEQVCNMLVRWQKNGRRRMIVSTNFSRITFAENGFVEHVLEICDETGVDCSQLVIEITESSNAVHVDQMSDTMQKLKARGIRFALDDVGTEYSTLEMFTLPELDIAKLDRSLIMRIASGSRDQVVVEKLIDLSHTLGMICVAEGVETKEQYDILKEFECDRIQGYMIGKPMPVGEFEEKFL